MSASPWDLLAAAARLRRAGWNTRDITPAALVAEMARAQIQQAPPSAYEHPAAVMNDSGSSADSAPDGADGVHGDFCETCGGELPTCGCSVIT